MIINTEQYEVELIDRELIDVGLTTIDVVTSAKCFIESLEDYLIINEVPTQLNTTTFQTANEYIEDSLVVYFNGIKEKLINKLSSTTFSFNIDIIVGDTIEIAYIKQS